VASATSLFNSRKRARVSALASDLYIHHRPRLLAIANKNSANSDDAEEALQDALFLFIDRFDPDNDAPPLAWLTLTLKRRCWALYHQRRRDWSKNSQGGEKQHFHAKRAPLDLQQHPDERAEISEATAELRQLLERLKPAELRALSLLALGYRYNEICQLTGWSYTKVDRCIKEGRAALRTNRP
jgi:RNA polymerase sigma factor (sigma-70 family)